MFGGLTSGAGAITALLATSCVIGSVSAYLPYVNTTVEKWEHPTCNKCPSDLCPAFGVYGASDGNHTFSCWTRGLNVAGNDSDRTWLRSENNCYVPQYKLVYNGTAEQDLPFCGPESQIISYTKQYARTRYDTECTANAFTNGANVKYYPPEKDLTLICWYNGTEIGMAHDNTWAKTLDKCYVSETTLYDPIYKEGLDWCGGISTSIEKRDELAAPKVRAASPEPIPALQNTKYLVNETIGEEYAKCYERPRTNSTVILTYNFNDIVTLQCYTAPPGRSGPLLWMMTTDFCYITEKDVWESPREG
ncbi:hypothetical protein BGZ60DRAFT_374262 [Tricladium varicosporioides]|nr:hypothetical protein BGZ60DRAFT_374262 [Hymenoscyphus varicosporioides]